MRVRPLRTGEVVHHAIGAHDIGLRELVALADFKVGAVVRGRHLERAGAEFAVHRLVEDDGDLFLRDGAPHMQAVQVLVAFVGRVDGHGLVARDGLGARR